MKSILDDCCLGLARYDDRPLQRDPRAYRETPLIAGVRRIDGDGPHILFCPSIDLWPVLSWLCSPTLRSMTTLSPIPGQARLMFMPVSTVLVIPPPNTYKAGEGRKFFSPEPHRPPPPSFLSICRTSSIPLLPSRLTAGTSSGVRFDIHLLIVRTEMLPPPLPQPTRSARPSVLLTWPLSNDGWKPNSVGRPRLARTPFPLSRPAMKSECCSGYWRLSWRTHDMQSCRRRSGGSFVHCF